MMVTNLEDPGGDKAMIVDVAEVSPVVRLDVENYGERASTETLINVLAPRGLEGFRWCHPDGGPMGQVPVPTDDDALDADGTAVPSGLLVNEVSRITRNGGFLFFFRFTLPVPDEGEQTCRIHVTVQADEMPDDVKEYTGDRVFRVKPREAEG
jgi:hypothetical protein